MVVLDRSKLSQSWYARVTLEEPQSAEPLREQFQGIRDLKSHGQLSLARINAYNDADNDVDNDVNTDAERDVDAAAYRGADTDVYNDADTAADSAADTDADHNADTVANTDVEATVESGPATAYSSSLYHHRAH